VGALSTLKPKFIGATTTADQALVAMTNAQKLANADGIVFTCPTLSGEHRVILWFTGRGADVARKPLQRFTLSGTGVSDLTLTPSIAFTVDTLGLSWNGNVTAGSAA